MRIKRIRKGVGGLPQKIRKHRSLGTSAKKGTVGGWDQREVRYWGLDAKIRYVTAERKTQIWKKKKELKKQLRGAGCVNGECGTTQRDGEPSKGNFLIPRKN